MIQFLFRNKKELKQGSLQKLFSKKLKNIENTLQVLEKNISYCFLTNYANK